MTDPSIAVAMLGAGARPVRGAASPVRESWIAIARRWFVARLNGAGRRP